MVVQMRKRTSRYILFVSIICIVTWVNFSTVEFSSSSHGQREGKNVISLYESQEEREREVESALSLYASLHDSPHDFEKERGRDETYTFTKKTSRETLTDPQREDKFIHSIYTQIEIEREKRVRPLSLSSAIKKENKKKNITFTPQQQSEKTVPKERERPKYREKQKLRERERERQTDRERKREVQGERAHREEVFVLGMHHSGTSVITRLLVEMGISAGPKKGLLIKKDNPLKFWELRAAVKLNSRILRERVAQRGKSSFGNDGGKANSRGHSWLGHGFALSGNMKKKFNPKVDITKFYERESREILSIYGTMRRNVPKSPWVIKDPRLSLTAPLWLSLSKSPLCIILLRDPVELSFRFLSYNQPGDAFNVKEWSQIWEEYTVRPLSACLSTNSPIVFVSYKMLALDPLTALSKLYHDLILKGIQKYTPSLYTPSLPLCLSIYLCVSLVLSLSRSVLSHSTSLSL